MRTSVCVLTAGLCMASSAAFGQWSDNFDSYSVGSLNGVGGWKGWDNVPAAAGIVSTVVARSAPNSQQVIGGPGGVGSIDSVHTYDLTSGVWRYVAWQYLPEEFTGTTYFILNNVYNDAGPYAWAVQLQFNATTGLVVDDTRVDLAQISFVRGAWAEIRVDFSLDDNIIQIFYNGEALSEGVWASGGGSSGTVALGGVDLYGNDCSPVYYDDLELIDMGGGGCPACAADFNQDGGVDGSDVEAFFNEWEGGGACGDVNLDGGVDGGDVEAFFTVWEAGGC